MVKQCPVKRKRIDIRVTEDFSLTDSKFQQYCIDNHLKESKEIKRLIAQLVAQKEPITIRYSKKLDDYQ